MATMPIIDVKYETDKIDVFDDIETIQNQTKTYSLQQNLRLSIFFKHTKRRTCIDITKTLQIY